MKASFILVIFFFVQSIAFAQSSDEELAAQYYANEEYDKAEVLYKKLLKKDQESVYIYQNYFNCLLKLKEYDEAEKMISKQIRKMPDKPMYSVDLGYLYSLQGQSQKTDDLFNDLIKNMGSSYMEAEQLASSFTKRSFFDLAIQTYLKGRNNLNAPTVFSEALIDLYYANKDYKGVVNECMELLYEDPRSLDLVQSRLIRLVDQDFETAYIQQQVVTYLQKNPEKIVYDDLMMWVFIQQKKFRSAMRQANAMDKRNNSEGRSLVNLAKVCASNNQYDVAIECYEKVLEFGPEGYFYLVARMGLLETSFTSLKYGAFPDSSQLNTLVGRYTKFLNEFGNDWKTANTVKQLADIYIYYLHDLNKGIALLENVIDIPRLQPHLKGGLKLSLGDAYLMRNDVWDAALLYGQVDKDFKEDPLGQEAKLRNARLSYFKGDFEWAKDQLDVLKTATSQLISNNAIELALTIQDNTGLDSTTDALQAYAQAQLLLFQNKYDECLNALGVLPFRFPNHSLEDEIAFTRAQVMEKKRDFVKAEEFYKTVVEYFGDDILADNALFRLAELYEFEMDNKQEAFKMYEKLILNYTGSLFVVESRKRYKKLKEELPVETVPVSP